MAARGQQWINEVWYGHSRAYWLLLPLSWLFRALVAARAFLYRAGAFATRRVAAPVVVVGNLTAGGAGKTPVTIWLVNALKARGLRPGVVSRGYRGEVGERPLTVLPDSDPRRVGDEPVLIARRCRCPVVVHPDRAAAAEVLVAEGVDVVVADDGLQHYALARDYEILVVDGERGVGNGNLLPAGPLREPLARAGRVDRILINGGDDGSLRRRLRAQVPSLRFELEAGAARRVDDSASRALSEFASRKVVAVAGIGHPARFFRLLAAHGVEAREHPLDDHGTPVGLSYGEGRAVLMTEKDAVKWTDSSAADVWYVPVDVAGLDDAWLEDIEKLVAERRDRNPA